MKTLIKNGLICTENGVFAADMLIEDEKIVALAQKITQKVDYEYDAHGKYVFPGGIDPHTHMELQQSSKYRSIDDFYHGGMIAAMGGTTTIIDHMAFGEENCTLSSRFAEYEKLAEKCPIDYSFHGVFQRVDEEKINELEDIIQHKPYPSFKAYTTYAYPMFDKEVLRVFQSMKKTGGILTVHCENDAITNLLKEQYAAQGHTEPIYQAISRPNEAEAEAVSRLCYFAHLAGDANFYVVHMSAKESLEEVKRFRNAGQENIYVETCIQYLCLTDDLFNEGENNEGIKWMLAPPLRKQADIDALWKGIREGHVQVVATDHCPFSLEEKYENRADYRKCPGGIAGVEERLAVLFSEGVQKNRISISDYVKVSSVNAAKIFGMYPQKGCLQVGSDADFYILDPKQSYILKKEDIHSKCGYSPYDGMTINCKIEDVFLRGKHIVKAGNFVGERGQGRLLRRVNEVYKL